MPVHEVFVRWRDQMRFDAHLHPDQVTSLDSAPAVGGQEAGSRPLDLLLASLAGCTAMDVLSILRKKRQSVAGLEVHVSGRQAEEHPRVFTDIEVVYVVAGTDVDPRAVERAIELSETQYCPAYAMLGKTATITSRYEIHPAAPSASA
jgi:putative redox protein